VDRIRPLNLGHHPVLSDRTGSECNRAAPRRVDKVLTRILKKSSGKPRLSDNLPQNRRIRYQ
jgi:hypothetical protein